MNFRTGWLNSTCKSQIREIRKLHFPPAVFFEFSPSSPLRNSSTKRFVDVMWKNFFSNFSEYEKSHGFAFLCEGFLCEF